MARKRGLCTVLKNSNGTVNWLTRLRHSPHCTLNNPFKQKYKHDNGIQYVIVGWKNFTMKADKFLCPFPYMGTEISVVMHLTKCCVFFGCEEFQFSKMTCTLPAGPGIRLVVELQRRTNIWSSVSSMSNPSQGSMPFTNLPFWLKETQCATLKWGLQTLPLLVPFKKDSGLLYSNYYRERIMFLWHHYVATSIWHRGIFIKAPYVAGSFLASEDSVTPKGNLGFLPFITENAEAWSASSFSPFHLLLPHACSCRPPSLYSHFLLPHILHTRSRRPTCTLVTLIFWSSCSTYSLSSLFVLSSLIFSVVVFLFVVWTGC